jgi:NAD(P)-dependent dehydrogenase (short-subunit alcohol dehydrogenase family)
MSEAKAKKTTLPPQAQARQPGREEKMHPKPESEARRYKAAGKLEGKWRGSAAAIAASENRSRFISRKKARTSRFCISKKTEDADRTRTLVEREGRRCPLLRADVGERQASEGAIRRTLDALGKLDILVNNAAEQHVAKSFDDIPPEQLEQTFRTNLFGMFYRSSPSRDRYRCSSSKKVSASTRSRRVRFGRR